MTLTANQKIKIVLQNILEKYTLAGGHSTTGIDFESDEVAIGIIDYEESWANVRDRELDRLLLIFNGLAKKNIIESFERKYRIHHSELVITDTYVIYFPKDFNVKALRYLKDLSGEYATYDEKSGSHKLKLDKIRGELYLLGDKGNKKIRISDDVNSRQARLFIHLFEPELGLNKSIESTFEAIKLPKDFANIEYIDEKKLIKNTFTEIQSILSQAKSKIRFKLGWKDDGVYMTVRKNSG